QHGSSSHVVSSGREGSPTPPTIADRGKPVTHSALGDEAERTDRLRSRCTNVTRPRFGQRFTPTSSGRPPAMTVDARTGTLEVPAVLCFDYDSGIPTLQRLITFSGHAQWTLLFVRDPLLRDVMTRNERDEA